MRLKDSYFYTLREDARDEDSVSGNLLVKGGFIKKTSAGVYIGIFIVAYLVLSLLMTVLQTHPYVNLLMAVILLLADIFVTDRIVNKMMNDRWILTAEKNNPPAGL